MKREAGREMATQFENVSYLAGTGDHGGTQGHECEPEQIAAAAIAHCLEHPDVCQLNAANTGRQHRMR